MASEGGRVAGYAVGGVGPLARRVVRPAVPSMLAEQALGAQLAMRRSAKDSVWFATPPPWSGEHARIRIDVSGFFECLCDSAP